MSTKVSSDINLENYKKGDSLSDPISNMIQGDDGNDDDTLFKTNPRSPGDFESRSFDLMNDYQKEITELQFIGTLYRTSTLNSGENTKEASPYHFFFMGQYLIVINLEKDLNKNFNMNILSSQYNRLTVCK